MTTKISWHRSVARDWCDTASPTNHVVRRAAEVELGEELIARIGLADNLKQNNSLVCRCQLDPLARLYPQADVSLYIQETLA